MEDMTTTPLTIECCRDLLKFGRDCHLVVANFTSVPMAGYPSTSNAVAKSKYTWKDCVHRIESYIGVPQQSQEFDRYSPEVPDPEDVNISPTPDFDIQDQHDPPEADSPAYRSTSYYTDKEFYFLEGCLQKMETDCGAKIWRDMYDDATTPLMYECCLYLLKIGRDCHLVVANFTSVPMLGSPSAINAVSKSKYTWKDCVRRVEIVLALRSLWNN
ncbi:hypothetical protein Rs2_25508 [Raphanus sativus]|nr:hypothetical protein Rs2_25508 [Raphanus sativus]